MGSIEFPTDENLWGNDTVEEFTIKNFENVTDSSRGFHIDIERCGDMSDSYLKVWQSFQWWCEGVLFTG